MIKNRLVLLIILLISFLTGCEYSTVPGERVDLRGNSTVGRPTGDYSVNIIRNQGSRNTCQTFAAIAGLEAAYKREMGLDLDLSEEFTNYLGKNFFLRYDLFGTGYSADKGENMLSVMGGGSGLGWIRQFVAGFGVPIDSRMVYRGSHSLSSYCPGGADCGYGTEEYYDFISLQKNIGDFNLNPTNLPIYALTSDLYYSVKSFEQVGDPSDPAQIENILREGYEIIWDFGIKGYTGNEDGDYIWRPQIFTGEVTVLKGVNLDNTDSLPINPTSIIWIKQGDETYVEGTNWQRNGNNIEWIGGGHVPLPGTEYTVRYTDENHVGDHVMLIVGFDKTDPDNPYFIGKNSWGSDGTADEDGDGIRDGWTFISYDYIQYGYLGTYITEVNPPKSWPELAFVGRWNTSFDGHHGILDIYHLPGILQEILDREGVGLHDQRIGVYYDEDGTAYRVNGRIEGNAITFYIDPDTPNMPIDQISGTSYTLFLYREEINTMSGYYFEDFVQKGAYALRCADNWGECGTNWLESSYDSPLPPSVESWFGHWHLNMDGYQGRLIINGFDDSVGVGGLSDGRIILDASLRGSDFPSDSSLLAWVDPEVPEVLTIELAHPVFGEFRKVYLWLLTSESGIGAGSSSHVFLGETDFGVYVKRRSPALVAKITSPPVVEGVSPRENTYLFGVQVFHDPAVECCTYYWSSEGRELSTEKIFSMWGYDLPSPGSNIIEVSVRDSAGNSAHDAITIRFPDNTPPTVEIDQPIDEATFTTEDMIQLSGTSFDPDNYPEFTLTDRSVNWRIDDGRLMHSLGHDPAPLYGLSVGKHTIRFEGYDGEARAADEVTVYVVNVEEAPPPPPPDPPPSEPGPNNLPQPIILQPANNQIFQADTYDSAKNQWYSAVTLIGAAFDVEDGALSGASLVWRSRLINGGPVQFSGTGESLTIKLFAPACYGHEYEITLTAKDSAGASKTFVIKVSINLFC